MTTERHLLDLLHLRLAASGSDTPRFVLAEHVRYEPLSGHTIADAIAVDTWGSGHYALHGYEVKVSRSDWLRELRKPQKAETWAQHCRFWWIIAPPGVVRDDLPHGWGLLTLRGDHLVRHTPATRRPDVLPLPPSATAGLLRATAATTNAQQRRLARTAGGATAFPIPTTYSTEGLTPPPEVITGTLAPSVWTAADCPVWDCTITAVHAHPGRTP